MRNYKTSKNNRISYIYYSANGEKIEILPGESGVTEVDIERLHLMDDKEVDEERRYSYRVSTSIEEDLLGSNSKYLKDNSSNPSLVLLQKEENEHRQELICRLREAMNNFLPHQQELFRMKYMENRTNTDIASKEKVTEAAIRKRLKSMQNKLRKSFC